MHSPTKIIAVLLLILATAIAAVALIFSKELAIAPGRVNTQDSESNADAAAAQAQADSQPNDVLLTEIESDLQNLEAEMNNLGEFDDGLEAPEFGSEFDEEF